MPVQKRHYVHTVNGAQVGFMYEPGSSLRSQGAVVHHIELGPDEKLLTSDEANMAIKRFVGVVVYGRTN